MTTAMLDPFTSDAARWDAVRRRDSAADGQFVYSVRTTGVYCRPSCGARPALRENVTFHLTPADADRAGFRPCKRCCPNLPSRAEREAALVTAACRTIESAAEPPLLNELAAQAGLSPHHFHRIFTRVAGVTPKAYAAASRQGRVQDHLSSGSAVTDAIYNAGFNSSSRFYELAPEILGMKATSYRNGGQSEVIWRAVRRCSLGHVLVAATERGICAILLGDDPDALVTDLERRFRNARIGEPEPRFAEWVVKVIRLVDDPAGPLGHGLPLDIRGTAFQRRVWEALRGIPAGKTASYSQVAERLGNPRAVRAVAAACAANNLAVAIPCHRVLAANGEMSGYRWGVERKRQLLELESK